MSARDFVATAKAIHADVTNQLGPPEAGIVSPSQPVIIMSLVNNTRGYIVKVANQANGAYSNGWYDASAVMVRRLIETLIIECFEHHQIANHIKDANGDFLFLRDLISRTLSETTWNLSRNTKQALPKLKDVGDKSAHSRRFVAQKGDLQPLLGDIRTVVQELLFIANLK